MDNLEAMRKAARDVFGNQPMIDAERQRREYAAQFAPGEGVRGQGPPVDQVKMPQGGTGGVRPATEGTERDRRHADEVMAARYEGWQEAHDPRPECGHPRACYLDKNWPESERNYDPETRTGEPPMEYHCVMCESEERGRRYREALERLQSGCFFLHPSEVKRIVDEALQ